MPSSWRCTFDKRVGTTQSRRERSVVRACAKISQKLFSNVSGVSRLSQWGMVKIVYRIKANKEAGQVLTHWTNKAKLGVTYVVTHE